MTIDKLLKIPIKSFNLTDFRIEKMDGLKKWGRVIFFLFHFLKSS